MYWVKFARELYFKFDLHITLAADLDRDFENNQYRRVFFDPKLQSAFLSFSPHGVSTVKPFTQPLGADLIPFVDETAAFTEFLPDLNQITDAIVKNAVPGRPVFHLYRFTFMNPTSIALILKELRQKHAAFNWEVLDPISFFYLLRQHLMNNDPMANTHIPTFLSHTLPISMKRGQNYRAQVSLRNDGWDTWNSPGTPEYQRYRLSYQWLFQGATEPTQGYHAAYIMGPVAPGETTTVEGLFTAPSELALYNLLLHFEQENVKKSPIEERVQILIE